MLFFILCLCKMFCCPCLYRLYSYFHHVLACIHIYIYIFMWQDDRFWFKWRKRERRIGAHTVLSIRTPVHSMTVFKLNINNICLYYCASSNSSNLQNTRIPNTKGINFTLRSPSDTTGHIMQIHNKM